MKTFNQLRSETSKDNADMYSLMTKAMNTMPGSPKQKELIKQINVIRKKLGLKLMKEYTRDYKAEYKKFQSSPERIKYRAELVKYNRDKGTYGNGDKKDASHKGGKIVGFEDQSKNRGRAEASRLKKEEDLPNPDMGSITKLSKPQKRHKKVK